MSRECSVITTGGIMIGVIGGRIQSIGLTASYIGAGELHQVVSVHLTQSDFAEVRCSCFWLSAGKVQPCPKSVVAAG